MQIMKEYVNVRRPSDFKRFVSKHQGAIRFWLLVVCLAIVGSVNG